MFCCQMVFAQYSKSIATLHVGKGWELCYLLWHSAKKKKMKSPKRNVRWASPCVDLERNGPGGGGGVNRLEPLLTKNIDPG